MSKILIVDNYDSFTYNLVHAIKSLGYSDIDVIRNDKLVLDEVEGYDKIILSPGPGLPRESGLMVPLLQRFAARKSILGVCLGHQAIGEVFGAKLENTPVVYHGVQTPVTRVGEDYLFADLPERFEVGRYHSWIVSREDFPDVLRVTAQDEAGVIMAMRHESLDVHGVQFHPESILTPLGTDMIRNFLSN